MAYFDYPSRYFADDKDIADILLSGRFSIKALLKIGFRKGVCLSSKLSKEAIVEELRMLPFSWAELTAILQSIEAEDRPEKNTVCKVESTASVEAVGDTIRAVQTQREGIFGEAFTCRTSGNRVFVEVKYTEVDQNQTRVLQHTWKTAEFTFEKVGSRIEVEYPNNERASKIAAKVLETLPVPEGSDRRRPETVDLSGINNPGKSTEFFIQLLRNVTGFSTSDVITVRMHKDAIEDEDDPEDTERNRELASELQGLVKDTTLGGRALLVSPHFRQFTQEGFAVMRISWHATEDSGERRKVELQAEFKGDNYNSFTYSCRWVWSTDTDGNLVKKSPNLAERAELNKKLRGAAFTVVEQLREASTAPEPEIASATV